MDTLAQQYMGNKARSMEISKLMNVHQILKFTYFTILNCFYNKPTTREKSL